MAVRKVKNRSESGAWIPLCQVPLLSVNFLLPMHISKTQCNEMILMKMGKKEEEKEKGAEEEMDRMNSQKQQRKPLRED